MRIACVLDNMFEDSEFKQPYDAFRQAGHEVTVIGIEAGSELKGYKGRETATSDRSIAEVSPDDFDALFIPGGYSPDKLRANDAVVSFTRTMVAADKPTFAICHGPQLLITAEVVDARRMTAWKTIQGDLEKVGARVEDVEVCVDENLVTSRKPDDLPAFCREALRVMEGAATEARQV